MTFRRIRILLLLGILVAVAGATWVEQSIVRTWNSPLAVHVIPINGDGSEEAARAVRDLDAADFDDINAFLERETARYGVKQSPVARFTVLPEVHKKPPPPPPPLEPSALNTIFWSLQLRWWVYQQSQQALPQLGTVKLFVLYHGRTDEALAHSLGLQNGLIGVVHAFADPRQARQNNIVVAHELLHTLGATDKYDPSGRPLYPHGYAEPELGPDLPRRDAEIMAGRLVGRNGEVVMPPGLEQCVIGALTAHEINFDEGFRQRFASAQ